MKKIFLFLSLACFLIAGCSKSEKKSETPPVMDFTINGVSDLNYKFEKAYLPLAFTLVSGPQEKVDLTLSGLPAGMKGTFAAASGTPTFATTLEFTHTGKVNAGSYPLKVMATTAAGKVKTVGMNLIVVDDCGKPMAGAYTGEVYVDGKMAGTFSNASASIKADNPNRIYFNPNDVGDAIILDLNCAEQTLAIAPNGDYTYTGTFTTSPAYIEIHETSSAGTNIYKFTHR
ncbi:MAG TPA: hypothetical protein VL092_11325 [Chitinophagaceae bacterium]|nr:hypothetical protein [Chitinophagaceae bacterium]